jgi:hypothetical protein
LCFAGYIYEIYTPISDRTANPQAWKLTNYPLPNTNSGKALQEEKLPISGLTFHENPCQIAGGA